MPRQTTKPFIKLFLPMMLVVVAGNGEELQPLEPST